MIRLSRHWRVMPKLKELDISEVNITELPVQAFYNSKNVENLILPNTLTTIGEEMFYQSRLKTPRPFQPELSYMYLTGEK